MIRVHTGLFHSADAQNKSWIQIRIFSLFQRVNAVFVESGNAHLYSTLVPFVCGEDPDGFRHLDGARLDDTCSRG